MTGSDSVKLREKENFHSPIFCEVCTALLYVVMPTIHSNYSVHFNGTFGFLGCEKFVVVVFSAFKDKNHLCFSYISPLVSLII